MTWRDTIRAALVAVRSHRLRSALTVLGILIGIAAVTLTVGLGQGARADVRDSITALGANVLVVSPGSSTDSSGVRGGFGSASTLTVQDATALLSADAAPDIAAVAPVSTTQASLVAGDTNWSTTLTGTTSAWQDIRDRAVAAGRFLTAEDETAAAAVVVLGPDTATELFGTTDVVGETVSYSGLQLEVVGVLESIDSTDEAAGNDVAIVPLATYAQRLIGGTTRDSVSTIYVEAGSEDVMAAAQQEATAILSMRHGILSGSDADFAITSESSILEAATSVDDTLTVMLGGIAGIALLVGGIGVMNIMLVSVTERIREIGLRKALGGRPSSIRRQFLVEASVLGFIGGVLGVALGAAGALVLPRLLDSRVIVSIPAAAGSIAIALAIGVIFGVYPASRAARLTPIDALRSD